MIQVEESGLNGENMLFAYYTTFQKTLFYISDVNRFFKKFYFELILDLQKLKKKYKKDFLIFFTLLPLSS